MNGGAADFWYPFRWTGPSFSAEGNAVAKETLELAHHGFIDS